MLDFKCSNASDHVSFNARASVPTGHEPGKNGQFLSYTSKAVGQSFVMDSLHLGFDCKAIAADR